jgi:hypothetical protein
MIPDKNEFLDKWIPALPQGSQIIRENAAYWYDEAIRIDKDRFEWHYDRLKGLGGSDVGEIATWKLGERNIFKTPWDIIKEKLCIHTIQPQTNDMRRGTLLEPIVQQIFLEDFNAIHREDLCSAIDNTVAHNHPWMRGNVDDVVEMCNLNYITDYKCPGEIHPGHTVMPYACQVHQYNYLLGQHLGKPEGEPGADGMLIAQFDYPNGCMDVVEIEYDPRIMQAVLDGGDEIWAHVLNGTFPENTFFQNEDLEFSDEKLMEIKKAEDLFIRQKIIADSATSAMNNAKSTLSSLLTGDGNHLVKGQKLPVDILSVSARESVHEDRLSKMISESHIDESIFKTTGVKFDVNKMAEKLEELECDLDEFLEKIWDLEKIKQYCDENNLEYPVKETVTPALRVNKKSIDKEVLGILKTRASELISGCIQSFTINGEQDSQATDFELSV